MCSGGRVDGFRADTKCCTYVPALPSFNVGLIFGLPDAEHGRRTVDERIAQRAGVTPPSRTSRSPRLHAPVGERQRAHRI